MMNIRKYIGGQTNINVWKTLRGSCSGKWEMRWNLYIEDEERRYKLKSKKKIWTEEFEVWTCIVLDLCEGNSEEDVEKLCSPDTWGRHVKTVQAIQIGSWHVLRWMWTFQTMSNNQRESFSCWKKSYSSELFTSKKLSKFVPL